MIHIASFILALWIIVLAIIFRKTIAEFFKGTTKQINQLNEKLEKENNDE